MKYAVLIPTFNGGSRWQEVVRSIQAQAPQPAKVLVIDSDSSDTTRQHACDAGFTVQIISQPEFDHGGTRNFGISLLTGIELVVLLTQDAVLQGPDAIAKLIGAFEQNSVAAAYGRQLPRKASSPSEAHARLFNYPDQPAIRSMKDIPLLGIKAAFCSNSFAAWRVEDLASIGGFPENTVFAEDMHAAAKLILMGKQVAYVANAVCEHSHAYTTAQEFRRAFDIGVFHSREPWLLEHFGKPEGEGRKFVISELKFVRAANPLLIPLVFVKSAAKILGYYLGKNEIFLWTGLKKWLSLNQSYWRKRHIATDQADD